MSVAIPDLDAKRLSTVKQKLLQKLLSATTVEPGARPLEPVCKPECCRLSFAQQRLWFLQQLHPFSSFYTIVRAYRLAGSLNEDALTRGLQELIRRHESLRTTFRLAGSEPTQVIVDDMQMAFTRVDLSNSPAESPNSAAVEFVQEQFRRPLNLSTGPLARFTLVRLSTEDHIFIVCIHHIVTDDWSLSIFFRELCAVYNALCANCSPVLPELALRYIDFALAEQEFLNTKAFETQLSYWKQRLADNSPVLNVPTRPSPAIWDSDAAAIVSFHIASGLAGVINEVCGQEKSTVFVFLLTVFAILLSRFSGDRDLSIGTIISSRDRKEWEPVFGFMTNTVVLRLRLEAASSFRQVLRHAREVLIEAHQNKDLPFEYLLRAMRSDQSNAHAPLFQAIAFKQNTYEDHLTLSGLHAELIPTTNPATDFDLSLALEESTRGLKVALQFKTVVLERDTAVRLIEDYEKTLQWVINKTNEPIGQISLLTAQELRRLTDWSSGKVECPTDRFIHQWFEKQVQITPEAPAISYMGQSLSYYELNARANQLARYLRKCGVGPERFVGIFMKRSVNAVLALLAVLKAGGAYVPIDPDYPSSRLQFIAEDAGFQVLLTQESLDGEKAFAQLHRIALNSEWGRIALNDEGNLEVQHNPESAAYVIYTSGSTGTPKAVVIPHQALTNQLLWLKSEFLLGCRDRVLQRTSLSFDAAVGEIFLALLSGARLVIADHKRSADADYLVGLMAGECITVADLPPSLLLVLLQHPEIQRCCALRSVMCGGETFPLELRERFFRTLNARIYNLYGPTEATIQSTFHCCSALEAAAFVSIGRPISNTHLYVLDDAMEALPLEVTGELHIGGTGVARGYLNRPDLTALRFLPNPFSQEPGARMYRTGDRVRWTRDGKTEYFGRSDNQVKIRGYRVELGEIEAGLLTHPRVQQAVVLLQRHETRQKELVAYVVAAAGETLQPDDLRLYLRSKLPEYMVPWHFILLEHLPISPTGKVDRNALPAPERYTRQYRAPRSAREEILCGIFAELLSARHFGIDDNFFSYGGHSLLATQVVSRIRMAFGLELPLQTVFESPTVAELIPRLQGAEPARTLLVPQPRPQYLPLSYAQQRLWFIDQMQQGSAEYNMPEALRLNGELDRVALYRTIQTIIQRHESLRTHFRQIGSEPVQVIAPEMELELPVEDLSELDNVIKQQRVERALEHEWEKPFDLTCGPLLRFFLIKLGQQSHVLLRTFHHIVSDGWSHGVFIREFAVLYDAYCEGRENPLKALPVQYADFTLWQRNCLREETLAAHVDYWKKQLAGLPDQSTLPIDHPRPLRQTFRARRLRMAVPQERAAALRQFAQSSDATLYMTMIAVFAVLLQRYTGVKDIAIGSPIANRQEAGLEQLIGFFVNSIVVRVQADPDLTFRKILAQVRSITLAAYTHQDLPFERLVAELSPQRSLNTTPIYQAVFAWQNAPLPKQQLKGIVIEPVRSDELRVRFDLELHVLDLGGTLELWWIYNRDLFDPWRIEQMAGHYIKLLEGLTEQPNERTGSIGFFDTQQRRTLLESFNAVSCPISPLTVVDMFDRQTEWTPYALAVACGTQQLTYEELNRCANGLAHQLSNRGVGPERKIGLCVERSVEVVVGLLGILKSGSAYVPLDPDYPLARLQYMVKDSGVDLIVASKPRFPFIEQTGAQTLLLDGFECAQEALSSTRPIISLLQLAYVIYTSGSTGQPKGVGVSHNNLLHSTQARWHTYECQPKRYLLLSSLAFDSSVAGLFWVLSQGGALYIPAKGTHNDVHALVELIAQSKMTHLLSLPTFYNQMLDEGGSPKLHSLESVIVAGESCPPELVEKHHALLPGTQLHNEYGPTEATVWSSVYSTEAGIRHRVPIGSPIANTQMYVLDSQMELAPLGVTGELYIGGTGVARGYLNHPELTADRFLPNALGGEPGARLYRTGDAGRWRPDGKLEFMGRNDQQVKIRGYRIELEEIEAALRGHEQVQDAVVIARERVGQLQLFGYVVLRNDPKENGREASLQVEQWRQLYESIYQQTSDSGDFNIVGWTSSYTGLPIPEDEMRMWVEEAAARLAALRPQKVLEIGCGTGLLLTRLARQTTTYVGVDFSAAALGQLGNYLARCGDMGHVVLRQGSADELSFVPDDSVDLVVLNSVIQYFPDIDYLLRALAEACRVTRTGGNIFIGDVRSLPLAETYYTSVQLHKASPEILLEELQQRVFEAQQCEKELLVDPALFTELAARWRKVSYAESALKPGPYDNDLSRFRYDVMLFLGPKKSLVAPTIWVHWDGEGNWRESVCRKLQDEPLQAVGLSGVPDRRIAVAVKAVQLLKSGGGELVRTARQLRAAIQDISGEDPNVIIHFAQELGAPITWQRFTADGLYQVVFNPQWQEDEKYDDSPGGDYGRFTNSPAQTDAQIELSGQLLDDLRRRLPEYMVPASLMVLPSWPLTATGKINRSALPSPHRRAYEYCAPVTSLEESLAEIWAEILGVSPVGRDDNFFDMGGHSLLIPRIRFAIRERLQRNVPVVDFFAFPTIRSLASNIEGIIREATVVSDSAQRAERQREFVLQQAQAFHALGFGGKQSQ